jgi:excisionase family DNA binding protein
MVAIRLLRSRGGYSVVARLLNVPKTTVHSWFRRNRIPAWRVEAVKQLPRVKRAKASSSYE